jgi:hypothetical protein
MYSEFHACPLYKPVTVQSNTCTSAPTHVNKWSISLEVADIFARACGWDWSVSPGNLGIELLNIEC